MFSTATSHPLLGFVFLLMKAAKGLSLLRLLGGVLLLKVFAVGFIISIFVKNCNRIFLGII